MGIVVQPARRAFLKRGAAIVAGSVLAREIPLNLLFTEIQARAMASPATEILYGGAAGGGKSHWLRQMLIIWCAEIAGLQCYLFRRHFDDLKRNHLEGPHSFHEMLQPWKLAGLVTIVEGEVRFWNGSKIHLCHCKDERHKYNYYGAEIHVLAVDELTSFPASIYNYLRFRVRAPGLKIPEAHVGRFPRVICGSNPGQIGHQWVKQAFVAPGRGGDPFQAADKDGGMLRQFIPARLKDNPFMARDDPGYEKRIMGLGSEAMVRAHLDGDWDIVAGAFFSEFTSDRHIIKPFSPPKGATLMRCIDWGSARPFSVGWYMLTDDAFPVTDLLGNRLLAPKGSLIRYREFYGQDPNDEPNKGLKWHIEDLVRGKDGEKGILARSGEEQYAYTVADRAMWAEDGGPSLAERARRAGLIMKPSDSDRLSGWDQVRYRLNPNDEDRPLLYITNNCEHFIRTFPVLQHDELKPEDVDTANEDHAADELRYMCKSRPRKIPDVKRGGMILPPNPYRFDVLTKEEKKTSKYRSTRV